MHRALFWRLLDKADKADKAPKATSSAKKKNKKNKITQNTEKSEKEIMCELCPRMCILKEGQTGTCGVRFVYKNVLYSMNYGKPCAIHLEPVEKKPLFHFYPGEEILSIGTVGCNLFCKHCQNWDISRATYKEIREQKKTSPKEVVKMANRTGCRLIAFTYNEPTVFYEYALDIAKEAKKNGIECVIVSNGYINKEPLKKLIGYISAANIDLKGDDLFYSKLSLVPDPEPIKENIVMLSKSGVHVEITNLLIPGENDSDEQVEKLSKWISESVGRETPLHLTAFSPMYKLMEKEKTPITTLLRAQKIAKKHLDFVYLGNVAGVNNDTLCPGCGTRLIERKGFGQDASNLMKGEECNQCPNCGREIPGSFRLEKCE